MAKKHTVFTDLLNGLNKEKIPYCLLRDLDAGNTDLQELDLLVSAKHKTKFEKILTEKNFKLKKSGSPFKKVFATFDDKLYLIDLHYAAIQRGMIYLDSDSIFQRTQNTDDGYSILGHEDRLIHLFYHSIIEKGQLQPKHLAMVRESAKKNPDETYLRQNIANAKIYGYFHNFFSEPEEFLAETKFAKKIKPEVVKYLKGKSLGNRFRSFYYRHLLKYFRRRKGISIAFMGFHGAGKTTTIEAIEGMLKQSKKLKYRYIYMGPFGIIRYPLLKWVYAKTIFPPKENWFLMMISKLKSKDIKYSYSYLLNKWLTGKIKGTIYYLAIYFELWQRYLFEVVPGLRKGEIVLCDRYVYDARYMYKKRPMEQFKFLRWIVCNFFPKPDYIFFMTNSAQQMTERKPRYKEDEIDLYQHLFRKSLERLPFEEIITNRPPEILAGEIVTQIMSLFLKRH